MYFIRNLLPKTLLARFILIITIPLVVGQLAAVFLFYDRHWYNVSYYNARLIVNEIQELLSNDTNLKDDNTDVYKYLNFSYQFIPKAKLPNKQKKLTEELEIFKNILNSTISKKNIIFLRSNVIEVLIEVRSGIIKITLPSKILMNPTTYIFVLRMLSLTILFLSISVIFSKKQIESIIELAKAADAFGSGKPYAYKPAGAKEIRRAGLALLKMKERIERQVSKRAQMLAMISHDLCTPLTRMRLQLELMPNFEEKNDLKQDIETMQNMVESYLAFVRGEGGEQFEVIDLSAWLTNLINHKWSTYNIELSLQTMHKAVQIKPNAFERAISNLLMNSAKYATKIKVSAYATDENQLILDIEDNGVGIKKEEREKVFKPFYRSDQSRSLGNSSNVGLGLSITKEIIVGHYGNIVLDDSENLGGLLVKILLPTYIQ